MTDAETYAFDLLLGSGLTTRPVDNARACIAIRAARTMGCEREIRELVKSKRAVHRDWLTMTQRKWQRGTRNPNKARHHDSIAIREQWVRGVA